MHQITSFTQNLRIRPNNYPRVDKGTMNRYREENNQKNYLNFILERFGIYFLAVIFAILVAYLSIRNSSWVGTTHPESWLHWESWLPREIEGWKEIYYFYGFDKPFLHGFFHFLYEILM